MTDGWGLFKTVLLYSNPARATRIHPFTQAYALHVRLYVCLCVYTLTTRPGARLEAAKHRPVAMATGGPRRLKGRAARFPERGRGRPGVASEVAPAL